MDSSKSIAICAARPRKISNQLTAAQTILSCQPVVSQPTRLTMTILVTPIYPTSSMFGSTYQPDGFGPIFQAIEHTRRMRNLSRRRIAMAAKTEAEAFFHEGHGRGIDSDAESSDRRTSRSPFTTPSNSPKLPRTALRRQAGHHFCKQLSMPVFAVDGTWPIRTERAERMIWERQCPCLLHCPCLPQATRPTPLLLPAPNLSAR